jgi:peptidoglycan/xylan/chitin deacetylase (PgdA/CDA1 family)
MSCIDRTTFTWPEGRRGAVSLTYDDGREDQREYAVPQLEAAGLRATFNPTIKGAFLGSADHWGAIAARGHELGNHTIFHPCLSEPERDRSKWLHAAYNLADYTERRFREEITIASWILNRIDGRTERTYANTCHDNWLGSGEGRRCLEPILADYFVAARGECTDNPVDITRINFNNLGTVAGDRKSVDYYRDRIEQTVEQGNWIIFTIHGVNAGAQGVIGDPRTHERLVRWLADNTDRIWTAPMIDVARHLRRFAVDETAP